MNPEPRVLCVVNYEPISIYVRNGISVDTLRRYYNPAGFFDEVHIVAVNDLDWTLSQEVRVHGTHPSKLLKTIVRVCRTENVCMLRNFEASWTHFVTLRAKAILGLPAVISLHDVLWPRTATLFDYIFTYVEWMAENIIQKYGCNNVMYLPNRIDENVFHPGTVQSLHIRGLAGKPRIVCIGRLNEEYKNISPLIRAVGLAKTVYPGVQLVIIGGGPDKKMYQEIIDKEGLENSVRLIGNQPEKEVAEYLRWCDFHALVNPFGDMGRPMVEALMTGKPVVATGGRGNSIYHLENGLNACLVPYADISSPKAMAEALIWMVQHLEQFDPLKIRERAISEYGYRRWAEEEARVYNDVLERYQRKRKGVRAANRVKAFCLSSLHLRSSIMQGLRGLMKLIAAVGLCWKARQK